MAKEIHINNYIKGTIKNNCKSFFNKLSFSGNTLQIPDTLTEDELKWLCSVLRRYEPTKRQLA